MVLLCLGPMGAQAVFRVEKASFKVNMPSQIAGDYDMAIANFGTPLYGATLRCVHAAPRALRLDVVECWVFFRQVKVRNQETV